MVPSWFSKHNSYSSFGNVPKNQTFVEIYIILTEDYQKACDAFLCAYVYIYIILWLHKLHFIDW